MRKILLTASVVISATLSAQITTDTFNFTGAMQTFTVPSCVTSVTITCYGAEGGTQVTYPQGSSGLGGMAQGVMAVTPGQVLNVFVGGQNGYNGGGTGGANGNTYFGGPQTGNAPNGGGGTDVRFGGITINDRVIVAGGGGGAGCNGTWPGCQVAGPAGNGGAGGGLNGGNGTFGVGTPCNCAGGGGDVGMGGSPSAGGTHGNYYGNTACLRSSWTAGQDGTLYQGGAGSTTYHNGTGGGGGGGGGYYGGGSGGSGSDTTPGGGGGGGSSWTGTLTGTATTAGVQTGNGIAYISYTIAGSLPPAPTTFSASNAVCVGDTITISTSVATATSYTWTAPAGWSIISANGNDSVTMVAGQLSDTVWVYATNNCGDGPVGYFVPTYNNNPGVNLGQDQTTCGVSVTLDAGNPGATYMWSDMSTSQTISAAVSGTYYVDVTDANGCSGSDTVVVTINTPPTVTASAAATMVCIADDTVQLTGTPAGGMWSGSCVVNNGQFVPGMCSPGSYTLIYFYMDSSMCYAEDSVIITTDLCLGIADVNADAFTFYPNPASGSFEIQFASDLSTVEIQITDASGRLVLDQRTGNVNAGSTVKISLDGISSGTYLLNLISGDTKSVRTLIVE